MRFRIKEYAFEQGLKLGDVAGKLRIPLSNLSAINSGSRSVSLRLLGRIANLLGCEVADLFDESEAVTVFRSPGVDRAVTRMEEGVASERTKRGSIASCLRGRDTMGA